MRLSMISQASPRDICSGLGRQHLDYIAVESPAHLVLRHEHIIVPVRHLHKAVALAGHAHRTRQFLFDKTFLLAFGFPLAAPMLFLLQIHLFLYRLALRRLVPVTPAAGTGRRSFLSTHTFYSISNGKYTQKPRAMQVYLQLPRRDRAASLLIGIAPVGKVWYFCLLEFRAEPL